MRLTLRTMLAYLDGILEPADRDEIGRKIEESEFARQLAQRLRDCLRNPDLAAPKVSGKATGLDPNLVAEYLDNTLAGERVPEFEKLCLDSDVFLAEVAACHQILTMVLGQPAEIDLEMKQLMYGIPSQASQQPSKPELVNVAADERAPALPDDLWVKPQRRKLEIPDYLRERPKRTHWKPIAAGALLLVILVVAVTLALGPLDHTHPIARLLGFGSAPENPANPAEAANQQGGDAAAADHGAGAGTPNESAKSEQSDNGGAAKSSDVNSASPQSVANSGEAAQKSSAEKPALSVLPTDTQPTAQNANPPGASVADTSAPSTASATPTTDRVASTTDSSMKPPPIPEPSSADAAAAATVPAASHTASNDAAGTAMPISPGPASTTPISPPSTSTAPLPGDTSVPKPASIMDAAPAPPAQPALEGVSLGRLLPSKEVVLLKFDTAAGQWARVPTGAAVTAGEQLLVLPTYRPTITLSAGITLQIPDETMLELQSPDGHGIPTVKLIYGRLIAITTGKAGAQLGLDAGGMKGIVSFVDAEATLAVEVRRYCSPGSNPEVEEPHVAADLYAVRGHLDWLSADGVATDLAAPQRWVLSANPAETMAGGPTAAPNLPKWIDPEQLRSYDAQASDYLAQSLQDDKPLLVALGEMVDHRRVEIKSLGAQCLALLDEFEPLVATFNDPDQRPMWSVDIASVKAAIARGPATATKVHQAFVKQRGDDLGKDLYRMFLGYTKEQLQNGEAAKLVDFLDHDNLDCRVLAFANLQEITNKTFNYRPEAPAASRAQPLHRWQEELRTNAIVPRDNPAK